MGEWEEDVLEAKMMSLQRENTVRTSPSHSVDSAVTFPRIDPTLQEHIPLLGAVKNAIAHSAVKWGSARHRKSYLHPQDDTMIEVRRLCLERRLEKDRVKRKTLSIALHTARQKTETETSDSSVQRSDTIGSAIASERSTTTNQSSDSWKGLMKRVGRRKWNICKDSLTLCTNTSKNSSQIHHTQKYLSGSGSDGRGKLFIPFRRLMVRERTGDCLDVQRNLHLGSAEDHVIDRDAFSSELDSDHWETENADKMWEQQLVTMVKKKNGKLTMRGFRPIAMLPTIYRLHSWTLQQLAGQALRSRRGPQYGHVPGRQAHEVVFMLRRVVEQATEWQISGLRDGLRCSSCV